MIAEVRSGRCARRTRKTLNATRNVEVSVHIGFTYQEGIPLPRTARPQRAPRVQHGSRCGGDRGILEQAPQLSLDRPVIPPGSLHLVDGQAVLAQQLARQLDIVGCARFARRPGEGQGVVHEAVANVGRGIAGRLSSEVDLGDPDLFEGTQFAGG